MNFREFRSTRPSRASTKVTFDVPADAKNFDPRGPRKPRRRTCGRKAAYFNFDPRGPREPRHGDMTGLSVNMRISIHEALASLDITAGELQDRCFGNFDPRGPREPRQLYGRDSRGNIYFDPRGPREPRQTCLTARFSWNIFRSTRPSRASTVYLLDDRVEETISIHEALASLDSGCDLYYSQQGNFDPRGPREPRRYRKSNGQYAAKFRSTRPSRASPSCFDSLMGLMSDFDPRGPREPRQGR